MRKLLHNLFFSFILSLMSTFSLAHPFLSVDVETGRILEHNQAFERWYPASLTKLMTAYIIFRAMSTGEISPTNTSPSANMRQKLLRIAQAIKLVLFSHLIQP